MTSHRQCDGWSRRDTLKMGVLGGLGGNLADFLRWSEHPQSGADSTRRSSRNAIFIELPGGPSHLDTFDLKPDAPLEIRGKFRPIDTVVPGLQICEHLPRLAQQADKFTVLRGVSHSLGAHPLGQKFLFTGNRPTPAIEYPAFGSVAARELKAPADLPSYVAIPRAAHGPGYLGVQFSPLATNEVPVPGRSFNVRGVSLQGGVTLTELQRRKKLRDQLDRTFAALEEQNELLDGLDAFSRKAFQMISSKRARDAFDVSQESAAFREQFSEDPFSQSCLLAVRLIEAGVRFVTLSLGGWDTHQDNFSKLQETLLPKLDAGLASLFAGLQAKGLLQSTTVMATGEFGRTPKINDRSAEGGRDHYPRCMFMLMGGGAVRGGQVIGASDATGAGPAHEAIHPEDVAASFYQALGIDPHQEYQTPTGRPVMLVRDGKIIPALLG